MSASKTRCPASGLVVLSLLLGYVAAGCGGAGDGGNEASTTAQPAVDSMMSVSSPDDAAIRDESKAAYTFHVVTHSDGGTYFSRVERGITDAADLLGHKVEVFRGNNDLDDMVEELNTILADGTDGLALSNPSPEVFAPIIDQARSLGIPVYTLNSGLHDDNEAISHVGMDWANQTLRGVQRLVDLGATRILLAHQEQW